MKVVRGLALTALCMLPSGILATVTQAQVYETALRSLDLFPNPSLRTPRLLGMGRMTLADDRNNQLGFWDFAGNPIGVLEADSASTFELRPATTSSAGSRDQIGSGRERQYVGSREIRVGYEAWRRTGTTAYGFHGDAAALRADGLFGETSLLRRDLKSPRVAGVLNGHVPYFEGGRVLYALTASYSQETHLDLYRTLFTNGVGEFLGKEGDFLASPDFFTPDEFHASTLGAGATLGWRAASSMTLVVGGEARSSHIRGANESVIHDSGTGEDRPYYTLNTAAKGRGFPLLGFATSSWPMEWIYDGRLWNSQAENRWVFTLKAGINQDPYSSRGKLLDRKEDGASQRFRVRWWAGRLQLAGEADLWRRTVEIRPPDPNDPTSFNRFISLTSHRDGADSLMLPDSVRFNHSEEREWSASSGATWKLARGLIGVEYHYAEQRLEQTLTGVGPERKLWDVRGGLEQRCTDVMIGRLGYLFRSDDRDLTTQKNEYTSHTATAGFGLAPLGSMWSFDFGWAIEWLKPDFDDPAKPRESRQQVLTQLRWAF